MKVLAGCFLTLDSWGDVELKTGVRPRVSWRVILRESTVKATFNTPCELLGGSGEESRGCCTKVGEGVMIIPRRGFRKLLEFL